MILLDQNTLFTSLCILFRVDRIRFRIRLMEDECLAKFDRSSNRCNVVKLSTLQS